MDGCRVLLLNDLHVVCCFHSLPARAALASLRWATGARSSTTTNKKGGADQDTADKDERRKVIVDANTLKQLYEGRFSGGGKLDSMERILEVSTGSRNIAFLFCLKWVSKSFL